MIEADKLEQSFLRSCKEYKRWGRQLDQQTQTLDRLSQLVPIAQLHQSDLTQIKREMLVHFDISLKLLARLTARSIRRDPCPCMKTKLTTHLAIAQQMRADHIDGKTIEFDPCHMFSAVLAKELGYRDGHALVKLKS